MRWVAMEVMAKDSDSCYQPPNNGWNVEWTPDFAVLIRSFNRCQLSRQCSVLLEILKFNARQISYYFLRRYSYSRTRTSPIFCSPADRSIVWILTESTLLCVMPGSDKRTDHYSITHTFLIQYWWIIQSKPFVETQFESIRKLFDRMNESCWKWNGFRP